jgi:hypothetical protein
MSAIVRCKCIIDGSEIAYTNREHSDIPRRYGRGHGEERDLKAKKMFARIHVSGNNASQCGMAFKF